MLDVAWTSAEAEEFATEAFNIALQTDNRLIEQRHITPLAAGGDHEKHHAV